MHAVKQMQQVRPVAETGLAGLIAGTSILTMDGELPVEHLSAGDRIITRDCGMAVLRGITAREGRAAPITVKPGAFGHTRPHQHTTVLPGTRILIRDWRAPALFGVKDALVPAIRLVDGEFVMAGKDQTMRVYTLAFDAPHILYADGLEIASA